MDLTLWILQILLAGLFIFSGVLKGTKTPEKLVEMGQTGIEGLPLPLIRFIALCELLGSIGLILPWKTQIYPILTPITAVCLGIIMVLAAFIHYRRKENTTVLANIFILLMCLLVFFGRMGVMN